METEEYIGRYNVENGTIHDMEKPLTMEETVHILNCYEDKLMEWLHEKNMMESIILKEEEIIRIMDKRNLKLEEMLATLGKL